MNVERTALPAIGVRSVFTTAEDRQVGVVSHHTGRRDLLIYRTDDLDAALSVSLTRQEAVTLARLLGVVDIVDPDQPD